MEKRINNKHRVYLQTFKDRIRDFVSNSECNNESANQILQFVYDYQPLTFEKIDFLIKVYLQSFAIKSCIDISPISSSSGSVGNSIISLRQSFHSE